MVIPPQIMVLLGAAEVVNTLSASAPGGASIIFGKANNSNVTGSGGEGTYPFNHGSMGAFLESCRGARVSITLDSKISKTGLVGMGIFFASCPTTFGDWLVDSLRFLVGGFPQFLTNHKQLVDWIHILQMRSTQSRWWLQPRIIVICAHKNPQNNSYLGFLCAQITIIFLIFFRVVESTEPSAGLLLMVEKAQRVVEGSKDQTEEYFSSVQIFEEGIWVTFIHRFFDFSCFFLKRNSWIYHTSH